MVDFHLNELRINYVHNNWLWIENTDDGFVIPMVATMVDYIFLRNTMNHDGRYYGCFFFICLIVVVLLVMMAIDDGE